MSLNNVCVDTNIWLDILLRNPDLVRYSELLIQAAYQQKFRLYLCAHSIPTIYYIGRKSSNATREYLSDILRDFNVLDTTTPLLKRALEFPVSDFEDAIVIQSAIEAKCDVIITHNQRDFRRSPIPAKSPKAYLGL